MALAHRAMTAAVIATVTLVDESIGLQRWTALQAGSETNVEQPDLPRTECVLART